MTSARTAEEAVRNATLTVMSHGIQSNSIRFNEAFVEALGTTGWALTPVPTPKVYARKVHYNQFTSDSDGQRHVVGFVKELNGNAHKNFRVNDSERHLATGDPESVTCSRCLKHGYAYGF